METKIFGSTKFEIYTELDELPSINFTKYNKFVFLDAGVGSDIAAVMNHISKIKNYAGTDKKAMFIELDNLEKSISLIMHETSTEHLALACLVHSINGKRVPISSDTDVVTISKSLKKAPVGLVKKLLGRLKKKLQSV